MKLLALLLLVTAVAADTAVTIHGELVRGPLRIEGETVFRTRGDKEDEFDRADFYLVEKDDGTLVWASDFVGRLRGYEYLARIERRERLAELLKDAVSARDSKLARAVLEQAEAAGLTGKQVEKRKKKIESLEKKNPKVNRKKADAVRAALKDVAAIAARVFLERVRKDTGPDHLRLLRAALRRNAMQPELLRLVEARVPKDWPLGGRYWLDFHLDLETQGVTLIPNDWRDLKRFRATWRPDLYGVSSGPMRLFTPVRDSKTLGTCLRYGQLLCAELAKIFSTNKPMVRVAKGLNLLLYTSRKEYMTVRGTGGHVRNQARLAWSVGHYSPTDSVSRFFWFKDVAAERRIAGTFVHELVHHWLREYNPIYADSQVRRSPAQPGYWIVEGFATFMEEWQFDIETMTVDPFDPRGTSVDTVQALARAPGKPLLSWDTLYKLNAIQMQELSVKEEIKFTRRWYMGRCSRSHARLFYDQAAATCHYLWHGENGKHRAELVRYVVDQYMGKTARMDIQASFGMTGAELGRKVEAYTRAVAGGWKPK